MTTPGTGTLAMSSHGVEFLRLESPDGQHEFVLYRCASGDEHYARRVGETLEVKTTPDLDGPGTELAAGQRLRDHLEQQEPGSWGLVRHVDEGECDCLIETTGGAQSLRVQVVRADVDAERWRFMRDVPSTAFYLEDDLTVDDAVDRLWSAVSKKEARYDPKTKSGLVLILDAYNVPEILIESVRSRLGLRMTESGFGQVWVTGPSPDLVWQLV